MQVIPIEKYSGHSPCSFFECRDCNLKFYTNEDFNQHLHETHNDPSSKSSENRDESFSECPQCFAKFTRKNNLARHIRQFHGCVSRSDKSTESATVSLQCPECGINFTRKSNLIRHVRRFHQSLVPSEIPRKPKLFGCPECDTKFTKWSNCRRHMRNFHELKNITDLQNHLLVSSAGDSELVTEEIEIFPRLSPICTIKEEPESTENENELCSVTEFLELAITTECLPMPKTRRKLLCSECNRNFSTSFNLRRHVKKAHPDKVTSLPASLPCFFNLSDVKKCPLCEFHENKLNLYVHLNNVHNVQILVESNDFETFQQFEEWRSKIETESRSRFVRFSKSLKSDTSRVVLICSQSDKNSSGFCPAEMTVVRHSQKCTAYFVKTHVGHEL